MCYGKLEQKKIQTIWGRKTDLIRKNRDTAVDHAWRSTKKLRIERYPGSAIYPVSSVTKWCPACREEIDEKFRPPLPAL